jgi:hypothetical protein
MNVAHQGKAEPLMNDLRNRENHFVSTLLHAVPFIISIAIHMKMIGRYVSPGFRTFGLAKPESGNRKAQRTIFMRTTGMAKIVVIRKQAGVTVVRQPTPYRLTLTIA